MDALQISGKWYISSRRAAKENGYHADYIGQLIRSGKVKGQKVGRSWYVLADSLTDYFEKEGKAPAVKSTRAAVSAAKAKDTEKEIGEPVVEEIKPPKPEEKEETSAEEIQAETETKPARASVNATQSPVRVPESRQSLIPKNLVQSMRQPIVRQQAPQPLLTYMPDTDPPYPQSQIREPQTTVSAPQSESAQNIPIHVTEPVPLPVSIARERNQYPTSHARRGFWLGLFILAVASLGLTIGVSALVSTTIQAGPVSTN